MTGNAMLLYRWFEEVWNRRRLEAIDEMFAPDGIAHGLGEAGADVRGPEDFRPFVELLLAAFPVFEVTVEDTVSEDDRVACRWRARLVHGGDGLGVPATGREIVTTGMAFVRVRDGRIAEAWNNWDLHGVLTAIDATRSPVHLVARDDGPSSSTTIT